MTPLTDARITGWGRAAPERILTNEELAVSLGVEASWMESRTGVQERRIASPEETTSDLSIKAARAALEQAGVQAEELDLIIVATITPDCPFPATACIVQDRLGATSAAAFDVSAACAGFVYALAIATDMVRAATFRKALVVGTDLLSRFVNWKDPVTAPLFGDASGAIVLEAAQEGFEARFTMHSDGSGFENVWIPAGGTARPPTAETLAAGQHFIHMKGKEVYRKAVRHISETLVKIADPAQIDLLISHQANLRILKDVAERVGLREDQIFLNLQRYGNTSAGSVPVAITEAWEQGRLKRGDRIVIMGFGAGFSWAAGSFRWLADPPTTRPSTQNSLASTSA